MRSFAFRQRGDLAADLIGKLAAIDNKQDFLLAADKFRRSFAPDFELSPKLQDTTETHSTRETSLRRKTNREDSKNKATVDEKEESDRKDGPSPFPRARALARQNALARELKGAIKGEITPGREEDELDAPKETGRDSGGLGDDVYRQIAALYEREFDRVPELGDPHQRGWDLRSIDLKTGTTRLNEVKGKGRQWAGDEVVELSRQQAHKAFGVLANRTTDSWYLYVVEQMDDGSYYVLPIANPIDAAAKWILVGESWRMLAEESRQIVFVPEGGDMSQVLPSA